MRYEVYDRPHSKIEPCRLCKELVPRSGMLGHAKRAHPAHFIAWLDGRASFGMSIWEHFAQRNVEPPMTKL